MANKVRYHNNQVFNYQIHCTPLPQWHGRVCVLLLTLQLMTTTPNLLILRPIISIQVYIFNFKTASCPPQVAVAIATNSLSCFIARSGIQCRSHCTKRVNNECRSYGCHMHADTCTLSAIYDGSTIYITVEKTIFPTLSAYGNLWIPVHLGHRTM